MATTLLPLDPATSPQRAVRVLPIAAHLLPDELITSRRAKKVRGWVLIILGIIAALLGSWYGLASLDVREAKDDLAGVNLERTVLQAKQNKFKEVTDVRAESAAIDGQLARLLAEDLRWSTLLNTLRTTGTDSATGITAVSGSLTSSASGGGTSPVDRLPTVGTRRIVGTLTVSGEAPDKNSIARYVDAVSKIDLFANVFLTTAAESAEKKVQFTLSVDITDAALGGRFSPTAAPAPAAATTTGGK